MNNFQKLLDKVLSEAKEITRAEILRNGKQIAYAKSGPEKYFDVNGTVWKISTKQGGTSNEGEVVKFRKKVRDGKIKANLDVPDRERT